MRHRSAYFGFLTATLCLIFLFLTFVSAQTDPLPSWYDGAAKRAILELIRVTTDSSNHNSYRANNALPHSIKMARPGLSSPFTRR
jgi:hypothetical protein